MNNFKVLKPKDAPEFTGPYTVYQKQWIVWPLFYRWKWLCTCSDLYLAAYHMVRVTK